MNVYCHQEQKSYSCFSSPLTFSAVTLVVLGVIATTSVALAGHQILGSKAPHFYQTLGKKIISIPIISSLSVSYLAYLILHSLCMQRKKDPVPLHPFLEEKFSIDAPRKESQVHPLESDFNIILPRENSTSVRDEAPSPKFRELQVDYEFELSDEEYFSADDECSESEESQVRDILIEKQAAIRSLDTWIEKPQTFFNLYLVHVYKPLRKPRLSTSEIKNRENNVSVHLEKIKKAFTKEIKQVTSIAELEAVQKDIQQAIGFPLFLFTRIISFIKNHTFSYWTIKIACGTIQSLQKIAKPLTLKDMKENKFSIYTPRFQQTDIPSILTDFIYESIDILATLPMYRENSQNKKLIELFESVYRDAAATSEISMIPKSFSTIEWYVPDEKGDKQLIANYKYFDLYEKIEKECFPET